MYVQARFESTDSGLKQILSEIIPEKQKEVKEFRQQHGSFGMGEVTIDQVRVQSIQPSSTIISRALETVDYVTSILECLISSLNLPILY